jgi:hypothetical protein
MPTMRTAAADTCWVSGRDRPARRLYQVMGGEAAAVSRGPG